LVSPSSYRSIVSAVDLTSETETIFRAAAFLAQNHGATICLLYFDPSFKENGQQPTAQELGIYSTRHLAPALRELPGSFSSQP
jgi:hypothetical protein